MTPIRRKLLWLIAARAFAVTLLLGSATLAHVRSPDAFPVDPFFVLIGLTYALTAVYSLTLRAAEARPWVVDAQLAADAVIVSAVVHLTGGVGSYFSSLYTLPIIAASVLQSWRGGMLIGGLSSLFYAVVALGPYAGLPLPQAAAQTVPLKVALYTVGLNAFGFLAVAALSGYLAEGLRRVDAQLQRASTELQDLQAFSQHVIDSLASGLATTDTAGRLLTFNRAAEGITGIRMAQAVGAHVMDVLQLPGECADLFEPVEGHRRLPRIELPFRRPDETVIELGLSTAPLLTPRGETGYIFTFLDVTEARRQEREARAQQRLAAVGEMAAGIAHEIRNPLASMSGSIQMLRQELPLTTEQSQLMDIVLRESDRLNATIRSFLAYARPQRQEAAPVDVRQLITDTARLLRNNAELVDGHEIVVDLPGDPVWYSADEGQVRQILWNLATNGLRAMPGGGRLRLSARLGPEALEIVVRDEGVGIPADEVDTIFQPFRGAFSRGTGLGLSIVHRIVTDHEGEIRVSSQPGSGTAVTVTLPVVADVVGSRQ